MTPTKLDLLIPRGTQWRKRVLIMQPDYAYKPIEVINKTSPLTITVEHGFPLDEWPIWIESTSSSQLNTNKARQLCRMAKAVDVDTIEINEFNGSDLSARGGFVVYHLPVDFTGCTVRMQVGSAVLTEANGVSIGLGFINIELSAAQADELIDGEHYTLHVTHDDGESEQWLCGRVVIFECGTDTSQLMTRANSGSVVTYDSNDKSVIVTAGTQGPRGPKGLDSNSVSAEPDNQITKKTDGLYVPPISWSKKEW